MRGEELLMNSADHQKERDIGQANRLPAQVAHNLGGVVAGRLGLGVALALALTLLASGALAAVLFRGPVDVSKADVQVTGDQTAIEGVESDVAIAADGTVYVVWEDDRDDPANTSDLYYTWSADNGASWPVDPSIPAYTSSAKLGDPTLAVSGTQVYMAWVEDAETSSSMVVQKVLIPASPLTYTVPKTPTTLTVYRPDMVTDSNGRLHVVFSGLDVNRGHLYYSNNSLPGGGWLTATRIYTAAHSLGAGNPRLARDPDDDSLHVVLQDWNTSILRSIHYISATNTAGTVSWGDPVLITSDTADLLLPDIAVDRDGVIHVVWSRVVRFGLNFQYNEGRPHYAYSTNRGATWTQRDIDSSKVYGVARSEPSNPWPRIATLPTTDTVEIYVVWEGERGDQGFWDDEVDGRLPAESAWLAVSSNRGTSWGLRKLSRTSDGPVAVRPVVATDPDRGTGHVVWTQQKSGTGTPYRTYYSQGTAPSDVVYLPIVLK